MKAVYSSLDAYLAIRMDGIDVGSQTDWIHILASTVYPVRWAPAQRRQSGRRCCLLTSVQQRAQAVGPTCCHRDPASSGSPFSHDSLRLPSLSTLPSVATQKKRAHFAIRREFLQYIGKDNDPHSHILSFSLTRHQFRTESEWRAVQQQKQRQRWTPSAAASSASSSVASASASVYVSVPL